MEKAIKGLIAMNILFTNFKDMLLRVQETTKVLDELDAQIGSIDNKKYHHPGKNRHRK